MWALLLVPAPRLVPSCLFVWWESVQIMWYVPIDALLLKGQLKLQQVQPLPQWACLPNKLAGVALTRYLANMSLVLTDMWHGVTKFSPRRSEVSCSKIKPANPKCPRIPWFWKGHVPSRTGHITVIAAKLFVLQLRVIEFASVYLQCLLAIWGGKSPCWFPVSVGPRVGARYAWRCCLELSKNGLSIIVVWLVLGYQEVPGDSCLWIPRCHRQEHLWPQVLHSRDMAARCLPRISDSTQIS